MAKCKSEKVYIAEVGEVVLKPLRRSRRISVRIRPTGEITVSYPASFKKPFALAFLQNHINWIRQQLDQIQSRRVKIITNLTQPIKTRYHEIRILPSNDSKFLIHKNNGKIEIFYPSFYQTTSTQVIKFVENFLIELYRDEAQAYLPNRVAYLARLYNFHYNRLKIKNLKSRWGSCSPQNNINLNLHLIRLPDKLIDYVILHELLHTKIKNHSLRFWQELEKILPEAKKLRRQLNQYSKIGYLSSPLITL